MLNPDEPSWMALRHGLDALVNALCGATLAAVIDDTPVLVCWSTPRSPMIDRWAPVAQLCDEVCEREMPRLARPLRRGGHISAVRGGSPVEVRRKGHLAALPGGVSRTRYIAESFASVYVLVIWFDAEADVDEQRHTLVVASLPTIAELVASLPPPDGPTTTASARRVQRRW